jgi:ankyrin repeat protein
LLLAGANPNIRNNEGKRPQEPGDRNYRYLQQRAEYIRNNPGAVRVPTGSHAEAQTFLNTITNFSPSNETMKLYKKRLTMLLPMIINGADVNVTTTETKGNTALHYAAGMGYYDLVEWLVNNGAEINRKTNRGKTPLDCVGNDPGNRIRNFLKNRGAVKSN